jgi:hypothetical protein
MRTIHIVLASQLLLVGMSAHARGQDSNPSTNGTNLATEVQELREAPSQTQKQLTGQASEIQTLTAQSKAGVVTPATDDLSPVDNEPRTYDLASPSHGTRGAVGIANSAQQASAQHDKQKRCGLFLVNDGILLTSMEVKSESRVHLGGFVGISEPPIGALPAARVDVQCLRGRSKAGSGRMDG